MKKIIAGLGFEITGILTVLCTSLIVSMSLENTTSWDTQMGRYWQTMLNMGLFPLLILGVVLLLAGIALTLWGVFSKTDK